MIEPHVRVPAVARQSPTRTPSTGDDAPTDAPTERPVVLYVAVFVGFLLVSTLLWWNVWVTGHPTSTITCQCGDPSQELWFLSWTPWALVHGHSPFLTNAIYAGQGGANMMANTSWMVPSILLAPITWLFGPIASFNVAATLGPAVSAWCGFLAARRLTSLVPAQVLGGLLFGFSPFVLWNDPFGHINFTFLYFPPLAFLLLYDLFVSKRRTPARTGMLLAVLVVAEFFTSSELLAMSTLLIGLTLVAAAAMAPRRAWSLRYRFLTAAAVAAPLILVLLAYPVWFAVHGPRSITGVPWANAGSWGTSPAALVDAGVHIHDPSYFTISGGYYGGTGPNAGPHHLPSLIYFGVPLLVFVGLSAVTWYRSRVAWMFVIGTLIAWLLSFGVSFANQIGSPSSPAGPWWLPWRFFGHIPLVEDILPIRFGVLVTFGVAMLLAISLDRWAGLATIALARRGSGDASRGSAGDTTVGRRTAPARTARLIAAVMMTGVGVLVLIPVAVTNSVPFTVRSTPVPRWFTLDTSHLAPRTIVLVVPFEGQRAMGWQAQTGFPFDLAGGFAVTPGPDGRSAFIAPPSEGIAALDRLSSDPESLQDTPLPSSQSSVDRVRSLIAQWHVGVTVITHQGRQPGYSVAYFTAVYGRLPSYRQSAWVWTGAPGATEGPLTATTLAHCSTAATVPDRLAGARCVLDATGAPGAPASAGPTVTALSTASGAAPGAEGVAANRSP